jgi:single-strand DNA-binding protein
MYQKVTFAGRLGNDPELRYTPDGTPVCAFTLAVNERRREREVTTWLKVTAWRKLAETCAQYLTKGRLVLVEGRLTPDADTGRPRIWQGRDGTPRADFEIEAVVVKFLDGPSGGQADAQGERAQEPRPYGPGGGEPPSEGPELQEEIPF